MDYLEEIKKELLVASDVLNTFMSNDDNIAKINSAATLMADVVKSGGKIFSCGNGGSHCDAMHFAEELTGRYRNDRPAYPAIAISDPSHLSCVSNDYGYEFVFSRYVEALGKAGDCLLGISTSGNSKNIIRAVETAKLKNMKIIILTGKNGGELANLADIEIRVPYFGYADRIQEIHIKVIHIMINIIEQRLSLKD